MTVDLSRLIHPAILKVKPYQVGKPIAECQREYNIEKVIKLASNENPYGCSPLVREYLQSGVSEMSRYPDSNGTTLKNTLSTKLQVYPENIILGNGSEDVLRGIIQGFAWGGKHILLSEHGFIAYKIIAQGMGIPTIEVPTVQFQMDLDSIAQAVTAETGIVILANPNNPTGTYFNEKSLCEFLAKIPPEVMVVLDEAYYEYATAYDYPQSIKLLNEYPNLIITRTFSKAYGLAGLRLGYGIAHTTIIELLGRIRLPFNINQIAQDAAVIALNDQKFVENTVFMNEQGKTQLYQAFIEQGLGFVPSSGNFVMVHFPLRAQEINAALLRKGIIVRPLVPYNLENYLRISIGQEHENEIFLENLETCIIEGNKHDNINTKAL